MNNWANDTGDSTAKAGTASAPLILIMGNVTAGKTTLGRKLQMQGTVKMVIEMDELNNMYGKKAWVSTVPKGQHANWKDPKIQEIHHKATNFLMKMLKIADKPLAITGVWPMHLEAVQRAGLQHKIVVVQAVSYSEARERWVNRGGKEERFFALFPTEESYEVNSRKMKDIYEAAKLEGRILEGYEWTI